MIEPTEQEVEQSKKENLKHIIQVHEIMMLLICELIKRARTHDESKLHDPELNVFAVYTSKLKDTTYGSDEYKQFLKEMEPALEHHYANNRHHPEHFEHGILGMNLVDLIEMICDWVAASRRHDDGDIQDSIKKNIERFDISPQLFHVLKHTADFIEEKEA